MWACGYVRQAMQAMAITLVFGEFLQCLDCSKACEKVAWRVFLGWFQKSLRACHFTYYSEQLLAQVAWNMLLCTPLWHLRHMASMIGSQLWQTVSISWVDLWYWQAGICWRSTCLAVDPVMVRLNSVLSFHSVPHLGIAARCSAF